MKTVYIQELYLVRQAVVNEHQTVTLLFLMSVQFVIFIRIATITAFTRPTTCVTMHCSSTVNVCRRKGGVVRYEINIKNVNFLLAQFRRSFLRLALVFTQYRIISMLTTLWSRQRKLEKKQTRQTLRTVKC